MSLADRQIPSLQQVFDRCNLLGRDREEEVPQCVVVVHHVAEECGLAGLERFYKLRRLLDKLKNLLVSLVLLTK